MQKKLFTFIQSELIKRKEQKILISYWIAAVKVLKYCRRVTAKFKKIRAVTLEKNRKINAVNLI